MVNARMEKLNAFPAADVLSFVFLSIFIKYRFVAESGKTLFKTPYYRLSTVTVAQNRVNRSADTANVLRTVKDRSVATCNIQRIRQS